MSQATTEDTERGLGDSLWTLTIAPAIWALYMLCTYITAAVWCEKYAGAKGQLGGVRVVIAVYTTVALVAIGVTAWVGHRVHKFGNGALPHDDDAPEDRHRFMGFAALLLSMLSAVATLFVAAVALFVETCD